MLNVSQKKMRLNSKLFSLVKLSALFLKLYKNNTIKVLEPKLNHFKWNNKSKKLIDFTLFKINN